MNERAIRCGAKGFGLAIDMAALQETLLVRNLVKRGVICGGIAAALALVLTMPVAYARPPDGRHGREDRPNQQQPVNEREVRQQDVQRSNGGEMQRPQRLSPEERRQLRRDIKDAGQEIYAPRR